MFWKNKLIWGLSCVCPAPYWRKYWEVTYLFWIATYAWKRYVVLGGFVDLVVKVITRSSFCLFKWNKLSSEISCLWSVSRVFQCFRRRFYFFLCCFEGCFYSSERKRGLGGKWSLWSLWYLSISAYYCYFFLLSWALEWTRKSLCYP